MTTEAMIEIKKFLSACVILAMTLAILAGCGGSGESGGGGEESATRTVGHAMGESEVPEEPERIVSLSPSATDGLVALGVERAGVATCTGRDFESYEYLEGELEGTPIVGTLIEPNLESLAAENPDLIIGSNPDFFEENYDQLSEIAPTAILPDDGGDFRNALGGLGEILAIEDEAEARIEEYEEKAAETQTELEEAVGEESVTFLRVTPEGLEIYGDVRLVGPILYGDLGLEPGPLVEELAMGEERVEISLERVPELGAEHLFVLDQTEDDMEELAGSPLWQMVPAVEEGNVYPTRRDTWIAAGVLASESMIEDIEASLME